MVSRLKVLVVFDVGGMRLNEQARGRLKAALPFGKKRRARATSLTGNVEILPASRAAFRVIGLMVPGRIARRQSLRRPVAN
jgi:hypothetical protein